MLAKGKCRFKSSKRVLAFEIGIGEAQSDHGCLVGSKPQVVVRRGFCSRLCRIHRDFRTMHDVVIDSILHVRSVVLNAEYPREVGLVFGKQELWRTLAMQPAIAG